MPYGRPHTWDGLPRACRGQPRNTDGQPHLYVGRPHALPGNPRTAMWMPKAQMWTLTQLSWTPTTRLQLPCVGLGMDGQNSRFGQPQRLATSSGWTATKLWPPAIVGLHENEPLPCGCPGDRAWPDLGICGRPHAFSGHPTSGHPMRNGPARCRRGHEPARSLRCGRVDAMCCVRAWTCVSTQAILRGRTCKDGKI